jgi:hypothetical protein
LLDGVLNEEKSATLPYDWLNRVFADEERRKAFIERHSLGTITPGICGFFDFYEARRHVILQRLQKLLGVSDTAESAASP